MSEYSIVKDKNKEDVFYIDDSLGNRMCEIPDWGYAEFICLAMNAHQELVSVRMEKDNE